MRRALVMATAIVSGVAVSGIVAAPITMWLPPALRRPETLGVLTLLTVGLTVWAFWGMAHPHPHRAQRSDEMRH
jgi:hypothetical protein